MTAGQHDAGFTSGRRSTEDGFTSVRRSTEHGFTLVEVMIALMIFAMIAGAGVALLAFSVRAQGATDARLDDVAAVSRTNALLAADLMQAVDRPARDTGGARRPAFVGGAGGAGVISLVRAGWSNLDGSARPTLQKVDYRLADGGLERVAYPQVDGAAPLPPALILEDVASIAARFRYAGAWSDRWDGTQGAALPDAAELTITRTGGVAYRLMFVVGTAWRPRGAELTPPAAGPGIGDAPPVA